MKTADDATFLTEIPSTRMLGYSILRSLLLEVEEGRPDYLEKN